MNRRDMLKLLGFLPGMAVTSREKPLELKDDDFNGPWHHVEIEREGNDVTVFIDGIEAPKLWGRHKRVDWYTTVVPRYPK